MTSKSADVQPPESPPDSKVVASPAGPAVRASLDTLFRSSQEGDVLTWDTICAAAGVPERPYTTCVALVRHLAREGLKFTPRRNIGYERVSHDVAAIENLPKGARKITRAARALTQEVQSIDLAQCKQETRLTIVAHATAAQMAEAVVQPRTIQKLGKTQDVTQICREFLLAVNRKEPESASTAMRTRSGQGKPTG